MQLERVLFNYEPYPVGHVPNVFDHGFYETLTQRWPSTSLFEFKASLGNKYSLSEVNQPDNYHRFIESEPAWRELHAMVKDPQFIERVVRLFKQHNVDLALDDARAVDPTAAPSAAKRLSAAWRRARGRGTKRELRSRFEFSMLPADGGHILPHTDSAGKLFTLVLSMNDETEWDSRWGGGTTILKPKDPKQSFNWINRQLPFDACETVHTYPFDPNQCVLFVKTHNSLHAVSPMTGPAGVMRRTLTINIEETRR